MQESIVDVQTAIQQTIPNIVSHVSEWCACSFEQTEDALKRIFNTELLLPLLKTLVVPLLSDGMAGKCWRELKCHPDFGEMAGLAGAVGKLPETGPTTKVRLV